MIIKEDKSEFESYLVDAANIKGNCNKVYFPETAEEIKQIIENANKEKINVTISAARTGLNGGSIPQNGILISTEKLNKIISIDSTTKTAIVEPGVQLAELQNELTKQKLFYPPDPTETNCSLGGTVANNASGARTFKYGPTRNFVNAINAVLPNGKEVFIKRGENLFHNYKTNFFSEDNTLINIEAPNYEMPNVKHAAGYFSKPQMDLIDLFIGAEGTLCVITKIELKLLELPQNIISMIIFFNDEDDIFKFVKESKNISQAKDNILNLREIEFFDKNTLSLLKSNFQNIPPNAKGAIWIEQETNLENEDQLLLMIEDLVEKHNGNVENIWFAIDENERKKLKEFRHSVPLKVNDIISGRDLVKVGTDTAVPDKEFYNFYLNTINLIEQNNIDYVVYGHIGNSHLHFNMLPKTKAELKLCKNLYAQICKNSVELGGTISAEHGIGKLKRDYLLDMFGEENIIKMAKTKKMLDPNMILNIGNIFEQKYLEMV